MNLGFFIRKKVHYHARKVGYHIGKFHLRFRQRRKARSAFNTLLIAVAIILIWRGIRGLADMYLFPKYKVVSLSVCLVVGLIILYLDDKKFEELSNK